MPNRFENEQETKELVNRIMNMLEKAPSIASRPTFTQQLVSPSLPAPVSLTQPSLSSPSSLSPSPSSSGSVLPPPSAENFNMFVVVSSVALVVGLIVVWAYLKR